MNTKQLKQKILSLAISGKLVPQDPSDEPASELLKRIKPERESTVEKGRKKKATTDTSHYQQQPPFELPKGWMWCKLGEVCLFLSRGRSPIYSEEKLYPVFAQKCNLKEGGISLENARFLDPNTLNKWKEEYKLRTGDILVNSTGTGTVGRTRLFDEKYLGNYPFVLPDSHISVVRIHKNIMSSYVYNYISSTLVQRYIEDNLAGSTNQKELYIGVLENLIISLPPFKEQQRIVQEVDRLFTLIDQLEEDKIALQQLITQLKSKILSLAIRGQLVPQDANDEPAEVLLKRINPEYKSRGNLHYQPFEIPKSWVWVEHQIILGISGGAQPSKSYFSEEKSPNYVRLYQIRDYGDKPMPVYIPKELANKLTQKGDILLARYGGSLGKVFIAEEGAYNVAMAKIVFKFEGLIDKDFAYYYYLSEIYQDKLKSISRTAQAGFNSTDLSDMLFVLPPYNEQKRIAKRITELFNIIDEIQNALNS